MPLKEQIRTKGSENKGGTKGQLGVLRGRKQIRPSDRAENPTQKDNLMWINSQQLAPNGEPAPPHLLGMEDRRGCIHRRDPGRGPARVKLRDSAGLGSGPGQGQISPTLEYSFSAEKLEEQET